MRRPWPAHRRAAELERADAGRWPDRQGVALILRRMTDAIVGESHTEFFAGADHGLTLFIPRQRPRLLWRRRSRRSALAAGSWASDAPAAPSISGLLAAPCISKTRCVLSKMDNNRHVICVSHERRDTANIRRRSSGLIPDHDLRALHHWAIDCWASGLLYPAETEVPSAGPHPMLSKLKC